VKPVFLHRLAAKVGSIPEIVRPEVDPEALTSIDAATLDDSFVYVHCYFQNKWENMLIRIWKTTYLVDERSASRSRLLHAENISIAPIWTQIPDKLEYNFLLIFSGLPKSCKQFDLVEEISEPGGFFVGNITRNDTDVYHIHISS
jgi:hypothetical protein